MQRGRLNYAATYPIKSGLRFSQRGIILLCFLFSISCSNTKAQATFSLWGDAGDSQIDKNGYTSLSGKAAYKYRALTVSASYSMLFSEWRETIHNGFKISLKRENQIGNFPFEASLFYLYKPVSQAIFEWDLGGLLLKSSGNWNFTIGAHSRIIRLKDSQFDDTRISEGFNLLYQIGYRFPIKTENWQFKATLTNFDHFLLLQETNPMVNLKACFLGITNLELFSEFWYRSAGFNNIQVNYFGYFLRIGALWNVNW